MKHWRLYLVALVLALWWLALCTLHAQTFQRSLPFLAKSGAATVPSSPDSALPSGIGHRWVAADLVSSPVSDWIDRTNFYHWTASGNNRPLWQTNVGVQFYGTNVMSATGNLGGVTIPYVMAAAFKFRSTSGAQGVIGQGLPDDQAVIGINGSANYYFLSDVGNTVAANTGLSFVIWAGSNNLAYPFYTNGVATMLNGRQGVNPKYIGRWGDNWATKFFNGTLMEAIWWTNRFVFPEAEASNVNWYFTQTYTNTSIP